MDKLLEIIKSRGFWKVVIRPTKFSENRISSLDECTQIIYKAWQIVKSRIRYKLKEYDLIPKILWFDLIKVKLVYTYLKCTIHFHNSFYPQ